MITEYTEWRKWLANEGVLQVDGEMARAVIKHKFSNTPANSQMMDEHKLVVLMEEVGEVATAITYDRGSLEDLKAELLQVATMSLAWLFSLQSTPKPVVSEAQGLWQMDTGPFAAADLIDPEANIQAAVAYIQKQYGDQLPDSYLKTKTNHLEPPYES